MKVTQKTKKAVTRKRKKGEESAPSLLPVLPLKEIVIFPGMIVPLQVISNKWIKVIDQVLVKDKMIVLFPQKEGKDEPGPEDLFHIGTKALIQKMLKYPDGSMRVLIEGLNRVKAVNYSAVDDYLLAELEVLEDKTEESIEVEALAKSSTQLFQKMVSLSPHLPKELEVAVVNIDEPGKLADFIASNIHISMDEKLTILEDVEVKRRLRKVALLLTRELDYMELGSKIQQQIQQEIDKSQRNYYLREQIKAIQKELGEGDEKAVEVKELKEKIEAAQMPEEAGKVAERELSRLEKMPTASAEYTVSRTYIDWLIALPWSVKTEDILDIAEAKRILDEDHYDLDDVKERILEYLAVRKLKEDMKGPILCFVGPPGVGKTSLGKSIARALGRRFVRISLGGIRDEAEIRGHRRTYIGSLPGRIIQGIKKAQSINPVFILDEIDKIGIDFRGDPSSALLEVLDPEQNFSFSDHYLEVPFDLSHVMFITTANILDTIPPALRDRMEVLELPGYIEEDKVKIAQGHLIPKQQKEHGLREDQVVFEEEALRKLIRDYTREAGLRNLERNIATICRKVAKEVAEGKQVKEDITADKVRGFLGSEKFYFEVAERTSEPGVATGLAWTPHGGEILFVESTSMEGSKKLILTGHLGEIMKESAHAAQSYVHANAKKLKIDEEMFKHHDIHIHVPAGAIPKDGPSAGIAIATAMISLLTNTPVKPDVAMTGEITLRGKVLPVGGIKEKILAAHRAGIKRVILPERNRKDLEEVPQKVKEEMQFHFVESIDQALQYSFNSPE